MGKIAIQGKKPLFGVLTKFGNMWNCRPKHRKGETNVNESVNRNRSKNICLEPKGGTCLAKGGGRTGPRKVELNEILGSGRFTNSTHRRV